MKMNYKISGNNYVCVAIDAEALIERFSAQFHNQDNTRKIVEQIRRWSENCKPGDITEIDGFTLSTTERK